jgi:hypothetical protein
MYLIPIFVRSIAGASFKITSYSCIIKLSKYALQLCNSLWLPSSTTKWPFPGLNCTYTNKHDEIKTIKQTWSNKYKQTNLVNYILTKKHGQTCKHILSCTLFCVWEAHLGGVDVKLEVQGYGKRKVLNKFLFVEKKIRD